MPISLPFSLPGPARALLLGVVTGLRSSVGPAVLSTALRRERDPDRVDRLLSGPAALTASAVSVVFELVADKLPVTPGRLSPGPLAVRLAAGAAVGGLVLRPRVALGAVLGAAGAGLGSVAGQRFREAAARRSSLPDPVWALAEDAAAAGLGLLAVSGRST
jgi:uncharacterized membrane protein